MREWRSAEREVNRRFSPFAREAARSVREFVKRRENVSKVPTSEDLYTS
jgi:hypothetical protein